MVAIKHIHVWIGGQTYLRWRPGHPPLCLLFSSYPILNKGSWRFMHVSIFNLQWPYSSHIKLEVRLLLLEIHWLIEKENEHIPLQYGDITRLINVGYLTRMLTVSMLLTFHHRIDQMQDYLMQVISQECWQDCNHKNDRMTRI